MSTQFDPEPIQQWRRKNYNPASVSGVRRKIAETETNRDLDKPIEQLLCDVHEESLDPGRTEWANIAGAQKRMVSLMTRVAQGNDVISKRMLQLTWVMAVMTAVILVFTVLMWIQSREAQNKVAAHEPPPPTASSNTSVQQTSDLRSTPGPGGGR